MSDSSPSLKDKLVYHRAPPALAARILDSLPDVAPAAPAPVRRRRWQLGWWPLGGWPGGWMAGSGFVGALAGAALVLLVQAPRGIPLTQALIDHHAAAMVSGHLMDVQTSNQHVVKPWLSAHLGVSPGIEDFAGEGFPLIGGRADMIEGRPTAIGVYRHDQHIIDLFAWASPGAGDEAPAETRSEGFNIVRWRQGGLTMAAVSDVEPAQLHRFVGLVRSETGGR